MIVSAIKSSKSIKIDDYTAIKIICALDAAIDYNSMLGYDATAEDLVNVRNALNKAYCVINPNAYCNEDK